MSTNYEETAMYRAGMKLVYLGNLLRDPRSPMIEIIKAAQDCGLQYQFRMVPGIPKGPTTEEKDSD